MKKIVLLAALAGTASAALAQNTGTLLTDGDARFQVGSPASATAGIPSSNTTTGGLTSAAFVIGGGTAGTDNTYQVWWWGRLQTTATNVRENTFFGASSRTTTANSVSYAFPTAAGVAGVSAVMTYTLWDNAFGVDTAQMMSTLTLTNNTGADVSMDYFFHVDNDIPSLSANTLDPLVVGSNYRQATQRGGTGLTTAISLVGFNANGAGLGTFSGINSQLTDSSTDNFIPDFGAAGATAPADYAYLMQWRVTIPAGGSVTLRADLLGSLNNAAFVPTPGSAALLGIGALAAARRRRV